MGKNISLAERAPVFHTRHTVPEYRITSKPVGPSVCVWRKSDYSATTWGYNSRTFYLVLNRRSSSNRKSSPKFSPKTEHKIIVLNPLLILNNPKQRNSTNIHICNGAVFCCCCLSTQSVCMFLHVH